MVACPTCGKELTFIKEYDRYYCYAEAKYAPKGYGAPPATAPPSGPAIAPESHDGHYHCPSCGKELSFIAQYGRYYCYAEQRYAPKGVQPVGGAPPAAAPAAEPAEPGEAGAAPVVEPVPTESFPVAVTEAAAAEEPKPEAAPAEAAREAPIVEAPAEAPPAAEPTRPALVRSAVTKAKKAQLMALCDAYGLDPIGTRTVLRDRLLQYMDDHRIDMGDEEVIVEAEPTPAPQIPSEVVEPARLAEAPPAVEPAPVEPAPVVEEPVREEPPVVEPAPEEVAPPAEAPTPEAAPVEPPALVEPPKAEPAPPVAEVKVEKPLACPTCGKDLTYVAKYDRLYCYSCGNYAPKEFGKEPAPAPPLSVVEVPKPAPVEVPKPVEAPAAAPVVIPAPVVAPPKVEVAKAAHPCPTCGAELRFIKDYDRWFCDAEHKYAPKDWGKPARNACPTCSKDLTWIPEYKRWYCYAESKYAPRTIAPPEGTAAPVAVPEVRVQAVAPAVSEERVVAVEQARHSHGKPTAGAALAGVGFALLIVWFLLSPLGPLGAPPFGFGVFNPLTLGVQALQILTLLAFIGLVLAMAGVVAGLASLRKR